MDPIADPINLPAARQLREDRKSDGRKEAPSRAPSEKAESQEKKKILCRQCRQGITDPEQRIAVQGSHLHTFANPHGIVFDIGCFQTVRNCAAMGPASIEFTWFAGFRWRVLICGGCLTHLGWMFSADGLEKFFGLIIDRLVFPQ
ncbi:MAG: cereblon family protein [Desulfobacterales bacterium]|jgi:hypothetical protein